MSKLTRIVGVVAALALVVTLTSYSTAAEKKEKVSAINKKCPLTGKAVNASKVIAVEVGLCCNNCKGKFDKDPLAYAAKVKDGKTCPISGRAGGKATSKVGVGVCCGGCAKKAGKDPYGVLAKVKS